MRIMLSLVFSLIFAANIVAQEIPILTFKEFSTRLEPKGDTIYVINFWATWCKPCVEELPYFERLHEEYSMYNLKITLVSLDFKSQYEKKLVPFANDNNIQSEILLLNAPNYNDWISQVSKNWGGSIPATLIIHKPTATRMFLEKQFSSYEEIEDLVKPFIND